MDEKHVPNAEAPIKVQGANPETIQCKDCVFRDKTIFEYEGKKISIGTIKSWCEVYSKDISSGGKPVGILFETEKCKYYRKDGS